MSSPVFVAETFSVIILGFLVYGVCFESKNSKVYTRAYIGCLIGGIACNVVNMLTTVVDGMIALTPLRYGLEIMSFLFGFWLVVLYVFYVYFYIKDRKPEIGKRLPVTVFYAMVACCVLLVVAVCFGGVFHIIDGHYETAWGYLWTQAAPVVGLVVIVIYIFHHAKTLGLHDTLAFISYMILPFASILFAAITGTQTMIYPAVALSLLLIYIMIQSEKEKSMTLKNFELYQKANRDALTKLYNRRAFEDRCEGMKDELMVGVAFFDLNALKYTNDHYGHKAGDELIVTLSSLLTKNFHVETIYRISGDEFVVIMEGIGEAQFEKIMQEAHRQVWSTERPIAALGYVHGHGKQIMYLVNKAEEAMYVDKQEFYEKFPKYVR